MDVQEFCPIYNLRSFFKFDKDSIYILNESGKVVSGKNNFFNLITQVKHIDKSRGIKLKVFPNPAKRSDVIKIQAEEKVSNFLIFDSNGRVFINMDLKKEGSRSTFTIDCSKIEPGIYSIKMYFISGESSVSKFVIL